MSQDLKNIGYYLVLPIGIMGGIVWGFQYHFNDLEKAVSVSATLIQALAIFIGGLWAYHKFDWGKRAESAIKMKALVMEYCQRHSDAAMQYRNDQAEGKDWMACWLAYSMAMIPVRNSFNSQVHLTCYLPKKLRNRIFEATFLALNKGRSPQNEDLDANWKKFGEEVKKLKEELDDVVSK